MFKTRKEMEDFFKGNKLSRLFHENSNFRYWPLGKELPYDVITKVHYKGYPRFKRIPLLRRFLKNLSLEEAIEKRKSIREFNKRKLTLVQISKILFYSFGIMGMTEKGNWDSARRSYPSAGARYPLEVYPIIFQSNDVKSGVYHYEVKSHSLELLREGDLMPQILETVTEINRWMENSSMIVLISAVFDRTQTKYEERGYRFILMEAGHVAQNASLMATALGLGSCLIGGFLDNKLNELLDLDRKEESVVNFIVIG
jgi:SagB-type dehydrogenase family enzyme